MIDTGRREGISYQQPFRVNLSQIPVKTGVLVFASFFAVSLLLMIPSASVQSESKPFEPTSGQAGKDVVWVPTPPTLVQKMLDLAKVTPADYVMDLGSGDGRNVIAAAQRGARALGVEYNPEMVNLSKQLAVNAGVAGKAQFVEGDMFEADISQATVLALFLLPENLDRLVQKFLDLKPGTRIVLNTFGIDGWTADGTERVDGDCGDWCEALLYIVPARVSGHWRFAEGLLRLEQRYQMLTGSFEAEGKRMTAVAGRVDGDHIRFLFNGVEYTGRVRGDHIEGQTGAGRAWSATRER